jgi:gliding motility-associated-like protein
MKRLLIFSLLILLGNVSVAQDFSNKGKDFWLCFPSHVPNERFGIVYPAKMSLFITSDKASSGAVSIPGIFQASFNVAAGQVMEIDIPYDIAHIKNTEANSVLRKGIRVKVDAGKPAVVVYSHIYAGFRSAASLILPANVLGKKYFSMNAPQQSISGSKSQFVILAVDTNTTVQVIPVRDGIKGQPFTVTLPLPGDLYEFQDDKDLTGSSIESISAGAEGCKKIAVFSGSSAININSNNPCAYGDSYDPLYQQLYPVNAWGKKYGFIPFENYTNGNPYRILASENNTVVTLNGVTVAMLNEGDYFPDKNSFGITEIKSVFITADKPVSVAQYAQRSGCSGATPPPDQGYGDPDMVLLNPVEQNVNDVTMFSSQKENIYPDSKFINILLKDQATGSFTINGSKPAANWKPMLPAGSGYSYAKIKLTAGQSSFTLSADSAFNAMAYGFGDFESYAYSAGTNVKDLYRALKIENEFGHADFPVSCKNSSFKISVTLPYQPTKIKVSFYGLFADEIIDNPVPVASSNVNGKVIYQYRLSNSYQADKTGIFPITVLTENASVNACNNREDEIDFELQIVERPKADWEFSSTGCVNQEIEFRDKSTGLGRTMKKWFWDFDDGVQSNIEGVKHFYPSEKNYRVKHWAVDAIGCGTDTVAKLVAITNTPVAKFSVPAITCEKTEIVLTNESVISGNGTIASYAWDFGDSQQMVVNNTDPVGHSYNSNTVHTVSLQATSGSGCKSEIATKELTVFAKPEAKMKSPFFCLPFGTGKFLNESTIKDGTTDQLNYAWDFGDGVTETSKDPVHQYTDKGPYEVKLKVTSTHGCMDELSTPVTTIYNQEKLNADIPLENCLGDISILSVATTASGNSKLTSIYWSEGDQTSFNRNAVAPGINELTHSFQFSQPGEHTLRIFGEMETSGCFTDTVIKTVYVNKLPVAGFKTDAPLCEKKPTSFLDTSSSADGAVTKWKWEISNGQESAEQNFSTVLNPGDYTIKLSIETGKGCKAQTGEKQIKIGHAPQPDFDVPLACEHDLNVPFINRSKIADGSENELTYHWDFGDSRATSSNSNFSSQKEPVHSFIKAGDYTIQLGVTSKNGCEAFVAKTLTVNSLVSGAGFTIDQPVVCSNQDMTIKDNSAIAVGKIIKTEIYWDFENDPQQKTIDDDPSIGEKYTHKYAGFTGTEKNHTIRYVVYSGASCSKEFTQVITVKASPAIQFDALPGICEEAIPIKITAYETGNLAGKGVFSGTGVSEDGMFSPKLARPGVHLINYAFTTNQGCSINKQQTIEVYPTPQANAGPDKTIEKGQMVELKGSGNGSYIWRPAIYINDTTTSTPKVNPDEDITYRLKVTSANHCTAIDDVTVKVLKEIFVPNAFTPNNDGKNDRWVIPDLVHYEDCVVQVFNRWGQRVYASSGYTQPWDGSLNGSALPAGNYVWQIQLKKGRKPLSGSVVLIR